MSLSNIGKLAKAKDIKGLEDAVKSIDDYSAAVKAMRNIKGFADKDKVDVLANVFKTVDQSQIASDLASVGTAATVVSTKFETLKTTVRGAWTVFGKFIKGAAVLAAAFAAFKILDEKFTLTKGTADKHYKNSLSDYNATASDLQSLNSQLEETKSRIYELNAMGNLSIVEQAELADLEKQNGLLETQVAIKQKLLDYQSKKLANDAKTSLEKDYTDSEILSDGTIMTSTGNIVELTSKKIDDLKALQKKRDELYAEQEQLEPKDTLFGFSSYEQNQNQLNEYDKDIAELSNDISSNIEEINSTASSLYNEDGNVREGFEGTVSLVEDLNNKFMTSAELAQTQEDKINNIFAKSDFEGIEDKLVASGKSGGKNSVLNKISEIEGLSEALDDAGLNANILSDHIMAIADPDTYNVDGIKKNLNSIFMGISDSANIPLSNFFIGKTDEELKNFWNYYKDNNLDAVSFDWSFEDLTTNFKKAQELAKSELQKNPLSFSDILAKDEATPTTVQDITDKFQSNISTIKSTLDSLKTGEYKDSDIIDLKQQFPELASETDNLQQSLTKLSLSEAEDTISGILKASEEITDPEKRKDVENYIGDIIDSVDLSSADEQTLIDLVNDRIWSGITGGDSVQRAQDIMNEFSNELNTQEGAEILWKILVDPSNADATIQELRDQYEGKEIDIEVRTNTENLENAQKDLSYLQDEASRIQTEMDNKSVLGLKVSESDYAKLIQNGNSQIDNLKDQIKYTESLQNKYKENEVLFKSYQNQIDGYNDSIRQIEVSQFEWNEAIKNLPLTNAQNLSSAMSNAMSELQSSTGLTYDSIKELTTQFSDLENSNIQDLFYNSAQGVKVNTSALKNLVEQQNKIQSGKFREEISAQENAIKAYQDAIGKDNTNSKLQEMQSNLEGLLQRQAQYFAEYMSQMNQLSDFQAIQDAKNTDNAGSHYDQLISDIKTAKEAFDKDLVGTDDFKTVARYLSPNGFDDAANFAENYKKAQRYLTEDSSGVVNFLNDLNEKGYATYETLANGAKQWSLNIDDAKKAAYDMGMGEEFFTDVLNKTEDYGFVNATVTSLEEGSVKIQEANTKLVDAYAKLAEMQASGASTDAIEQQKQVVADLEDNLNNVNSALDGYKAASARSYTEGLVGLKNQVSYLNEIRKQAESVGNTQLAEGLGNVIESLGQKYGIKISNFEIDEDSLNKAIQDAGIGSFDNPLSAADYGFEIGSAESKYFEDATLKISKQKDALQDYFGVLSQYSAEDLRNIKLGDEKYNIQGLEGAEDALEGIASEAGLSTYEVSQLVNVLEAVGVLKPRINVNTEEVQEGIDKLQELQEKGEITSNIDFNANIAEMTEDELAGRFNELMIIKAGLEVDTSEYDAVCALIEQTQLQMHINAALNETGGIEEFLGLTQEEQKEILLNVGVDDGEVDSTLDKIKEMGKNVDASITVKMDKDQFGQLLEGQNTSEISVIANNEEATSAIDEAVQYGNEQTSTITVDANPAPAISKAAFAVHQINSMNATIPVSANTGGLVGQVQSALSSGSYSISVSAHVTGLPSGGPQPAYTGTMLSPAHVSGTAYNVINYKNAYADGKVALEKDEVALVNELGRESIIRGNQWMLLPPGMHTQSLKKGDIVLNARQTKSLMEYGKAPGYARAYARGTVSDNNSFISKYTTGGGVIGGNRNTTSSSSSTSNAVNSISNAANSISNAADNIESASSSLDDIISRLNDNIKDWIEISLDRADRIIENFKTLAENYGGYSKTDNNLARAIDAVKNKLSLEQAAKQRYTEYADQVAREVGLSDELKQRVQNGTIDIQSLSEDDKKRVEAYEQWYNRILDCTEAIRDLREEQRSLAQQRVDNVIESYDIINGKREAAANRAAARQELRVQQGYSQAQGSEYMRLMNQQLYYTNEQQRFTQQEISDYKKQMRNFLKQNGNNKKDPAYQRMLSQLIELETASAELAVAAEELKDEIQDAKERIIQWTVDRWDRAGQRQDAVISYRRSTDNPNQQVSERDYTERIHTTSNEIESLQQLYDEKYDYYVRNFRTLDNEEAQQRLDELTNLQTQILSAASDIEEYRNAIMELRWQGFYEEQEQLETLISEYDTLRELIGDEGNFNHDGSFTENGVANIVLLQESIDAAKQEIANYQGQLDNLEEQYRNGNFSTEEYLEKTKELTEGIRSSATAMEGYRQSMLDMYKEQIQMENDLLQENIDKRIDALEAKKDYYDYDKTLKKKSKDINALKAQIAALEGTTNAAAKARLEQLKADLSEAEDDMQDTIYQHQVDMKKSGYETLSEQSENILNSTLEALQTNADLQEGVISNMLENVTSRYETAFNHINDIIRNSGLVMSETFNEIFTNFPNFNTGSVSDTTPGSSVTNSNNSAIPGVSDNAQDAVDNAANNNDTSSEAGNEKPSVTYKLTLDKHELYMAVGVDDKYKLKATISPTPPDKTVTWSSSNEKVVKVKSDGTVWVRGKGTATVTAQSKYAIAANDKCKVYVADNSITKTISALEKTTGVKVTEEARRKAYENAYKDQNEDPMAVILDGTRAVVDSWFSQLADRPNGSKDIPEGTDALKTYIMKKGKKVTVEQLRTLGKILGVDVSGKYTTWNKKVLREYKSLGYAKGGIVRNLIPADMSEILGKAVINNGDDGWGTLKYGETVMPEEFTKLLKPAINVMHEFVNMPKAAMPKVPENIIIKAVNDSAASDNTGNSIVNINIDGNVDKYVFSDLKTVANELGKYINRMQRR